MQTAKERNLDTIPAGDLKIIALESCRELGEKINDYILSWRKERQHTQIDPSTLQGYDEKTFLVPVRNPRFGTGEAKGQIFASVRGDDVYLLVDVCNYSITYRMNSLVNRMSPDDHFQDLKRVIAAVSGKARRINVIMPYLYESRQMVRTMRESLDCAIALQELTDMGVDSIITFDAHDPRIQNAIPMQSFEVFHTSYQFIKGIYKRVNDFKPDPEHLMVVSPDEGGMKRAIYMANVFGGVDMGMFYKRRDYTKVVNGVNPVIAHEFLGTSVRGKDIVILDDMISSGNTVLETARALKERGASRIFICATFGIFTTGLDRFDQAYEEGLFHSILTTNLTYQSPELMSKPYYHGCDMSKFLALIIDTLNHDGSISDLLDPVDRIRHFLDEQKAKNS